MNHNDSRESSTGSVGPINSRTSTESRESIRETMQPTGHLHALLIQETPNPAPSSTSASVLLQPRSAALGAILPEKVAIIRPDLAQLYTADAVRSA